MSYFVIVALLVTAIAAWTDWRTGLIPNWLTAGAALCGVAGHFIAGALQEGWRLGATEAAMAFAGLAFCSLAPGFMYWKGAMGGGDLKLLAALGALCQPMLGIEAQMYCFVAAAVIAPAQLAYRGELSRVLGNSLALVVNPLRPAAERREVPPELMSWFRLGPAIFLGVMFVVVVHGYEFFS